METSNVEEEIKAYGLASLEKFIVREGTTEFVKYLKVRDLLGECFYLHLDDVGQVCTNGRCENVLDSGNSSGSGLPMAVKLSTIDRLNLALAGVIFECAGSFCVLQRKPDQAFQFEESTYGQPLLDFLNPMGYPIVKLSELRRNPQVALAVASENYRENRNIVYDRVVKEIGTQIEITNKYMGLLQGFFKQAEAASKGLTESIDFLEKRVQRYPQRTLTPEEVEERSLVMYNLQKRNEMLEEFTRIGSQFLQIQQEEFGKMEQLQSLLERFKPFEMTGYLMKP